MTFGELIEFLRAELGPDGDVPMDLPTASPYFSSSFGLRVQLLLAAFTKDCCSLYSSMEEITIEAGDREFSFEDTDNCDLSFFDVDELWVNDYRLDKLPNVRNVIKWWTPTSPAGTPMSFAQLTSTKIVFDVEWADAPDDAYVRGWYRHPAPTDDDSLVEIPDDELLWFLPYASANLRANVASDEIGLARLQMVNRQAAAAVLKLRGENMARHFQGMTRGLN